MNSPRRILITGATGCAGTHLSELALARHAQVFGFARRGTFVPKVAGYQGDVLKREDLDRCLADCQPDWVFHLAAQVHGSGVHSPEAILRVNIEGTHHLLESVRQIVPQARVLISGSSGIYGEPTNETLPINEETEFQPRSTYALSKATQDMMARQIHLAHGMHIVRARTFNQTGPREPEGLVCAMLAKQIAKMEVGLQEPVLNVFTLKSSRDFCDVRDVVNGYWAALEHGVSGEAYNVCTGRSHSIQSVVDLLLAHSNLREVTINEASPQRETGLITHQIGDPSKLKSCSDWSPQIPLEQSLADLLDEHRKILH
jgi:GDP-4-dehydro-6-deoxy-D-mannose reductase